ncbi:MAG: aconitase/3-isopropylmalate dehydratase large subunit family protein [bacterium]|nr:aconitase/3-isopropylmalate dehydratase large subunit family protein [bacterium]
MISQIIGTISTIFSDDVNTDDIIPAYTLQESTDRAYFAKYAFINYDSDFVKRSKKYQENIVIAGKNFACGSSREQAVYALSENNVKVVIALSYPDIFYRNSLNNGLVCLLVNNISFFKLNQNVTIDLEKKLIILGKNKIRILNSNEDIKTFSLGGKIGKVRSKLELLLENDRCRGERDPNSAQIRCMRSRSSTNGNETETESVILSKQKSQTIVEKIVSDHAGKSVFAGEILDLPIDILFFNEVIGPPAIKDFKTNFGDIFKKNKIKEKVFDSKRVFFVPDHTVPSSSVAVSEGIDLMEQFAKEQGIKCYKEGDGIEHVVLIEDGNIVPGEIILGTDSHTDTNGALNTLAFGIGTTDGTYALATGYLFDFIVPKTIRINLNGTFSKGVYGKDLILFLIGMLGVDGVSKQIVEFGGSGLKDISMEQRTTIANMAVEMGARTAIFEPDEKLELYIKNRNKFPYKTYLPDKNCMYSKTIEVDLSKIEPCVAFPHKPSNVTFVSKLEDFMKKSQKSKSIDFVKVDSLKITDAFLGACTNGRYEDFVEAAKIIKGKKVHPDVNFVVIPASRNVYKKLLENGILQIFIEAEANVESSNCGPCFGKHMGVVGKGAQIISSSNRNYIGRMGSKDAKIFLASPITVTAAAIEGKIVDPRNFL